MGPRECLNRRGGELAIVGDALAARADDFDLFVLTAGPATALAHPPDQNVQISNITVGAMQVTVELDFTPGVLLAPEVLPVLAGDVDDVVSAKEAREYAQSIVDGVSLSIDGDVVGLTLMNVEMPVYLNFQDGYGLSKIVTVADLPAGTFVTHKLENACDRYRKGLRGQSVNPLPRRSVTGSCLVELFCPVFRTAVGFAAFHKQVTPYFS